MEYPQKIYSMAQKQGGESNINNVPPQATSMIKHFPTPIHPGTESQKPLPFSWGKKFHSAK